MTIAKTISNVLIWLTLLSFTAQGIIEFSTDNLTADCIILTSVLITLLYFRWSEALETHPLSSFALFGFCVTSQFGALLVQSLAWTPVVSSLHQPLITFSMLFMYQMIMLLAHALYRIMTKSSSPGLVRQTLQRMGVYSQPSILELWIMGCIGLLSLLLSKFSPVANGMSFLAWSPFLIPIYAQQSEYVYCNRKLNYLGLVGYLVLISVIAMAFNARSLMLSGVATVLLIYLITWMRSEKLFTAQMFIRFSMFCLLALALSWPVSNLVTAMVMARGDRAKSTGAEMISKSLENFQHPDKIRLYRIQAVLDELHTAYDEKYVENPMLARLILTKYDDNAIYYAGKISDKGKDELVKYSTDIFWKTLPQPVLDAFKIDIDKNGSEFSMGDVLVNLSEGLPLGGFKVGSIFGEGWALFGLAFALIYFAICLVMFTVIELFSFESIDGRREMAVIGMLTLWPHFLFGIAADSMGQVFQSVVRGVPQTVILYAMVFYIAKLISNLLKISPVLPVKLKKN